jgi:uncharacterized membrane protein YqjE
MPQDAAEDGAARAPVRTLARTVLGFVETRLRLAALELEEQALRLAEIAVWLAAALFFLALALVFGAVLFVLLVPEGGRLAAAGVLALAFLGAGAGAALMLRRRLAERPPFLAATLAELARDRERFAGRASGREGSS